MQFRYFTTRKGAAVPRFGTDTFLGCKRTPDGFVWSPDEISRLPADEMAKHAKAYKRLLDCGDLVEVKESDWDAWVKATEAASKKRAAEMKKKQAADQKAAQAAATQIEEREADNRTNASAAQEAMDAVLDENSDQSLDEAAAGGSEIQEDKLPSRGGKRRSKKSKKNNGDNQ